MARCAAPDSSLRFQTPRVVWDVHPFLPRVRVQIAFLSGHQVLYSRGAVAPTPRTSRPLSMLSSQHIDTHIRVTRAIWYSFATRGSVQAPQAATAREMLWVYMLGIGRVYSLLVSMLASCGRCGHVFYRRSVDLEKSHNNHARLTCMCAVWILHAHVVQFTSLTVSWLSCPWRYCQEGKMMAGAPADWFLLLRHVLVRISRGLAWLLGEA